MMMESDDYPMHIGAMQLFRPPVGVDDLARQMYDAMLTQTDVEAMFATHPALTRRGRSILRWDSEDEIDIDYHVQYVSLPEPGVSGN